MSIDETASTADSAAPTSLLADLESRQDELLRLLAELEARTEQALADLGVKVSGDQVVNPPATTPATSRQDSGKAAAKKR